MRRPTTTTLLILMGLSMPTINAAAPDTTLLAQDLVPMNQVALNTIIAKAIPDEEELDDEEFYDEEEEEESEDFDLEVEDEEAPRPSRQTAPSKQAQSRPSIIPASPAVVPQAPVLTNTSTSPATETSSTAKVQEPIKLSEELEDQIQKDLEAAKDKDQKRYVKLANTFKLTSQDLENLYSQYGSVLKGLNPDNPRDLKEITKLIEIVGIPKNEKKPPREPSIKTPPTDDPIVNFSARNVATRDAFATLARASGKSITVSGSIQDRDMISVIEINNQPFTKAFLSLIEAADVDFSHSGDNYTISKKKGTKSTSLLTGFDSTDIDTTLPLEQRYADLAYDNEDLSNIIKELSNKYGVDVVLTATPTDKVTLKVKSVNIEEAFELLFAGSQFNYTRKGDTFVIYSSANKNFSLDKKTILFPLKYLAAQDASKLLPAELKNLVQISDNQNAFIAEGSKAELTKLFDFIRTIDKPIPQVELNVKLVEVSKSTVRKNDIYQNAFGIGEFGKVISSAATGAASTAGSVVRGLDVKLGTDELSIFKNQPTFSQTSDNSQIKVNQRLLVTSGKSAKINFDQDINVILNAADGTGQGLAVAQTQRIQRVTAGNSMDITPIVGGGGVVTVKVEVEVSANSGLNSQGIPGQTVRRRISSEIQINNDETIAIGGLFDDRKSLNNSNEIPLLSRLPVIGHLFANQTKDKNLKELLILITPHVKTGEDTEELYIQAQGS